MPVVWRCDLEDGGVQPHDLPLLLHALLLELLSDRNIDVESAFDGKTVNAYIKFETQTKRHQDVPREFHFGEISDYEAHVSHQNESSSHNVRIMSDKSVRYTLPDKCTDPKSDNSRIVFLKTHKTASSTIQNILMRYGTKVIYLNSSTDRLLSLFRNAHFYILDQP